MYLTYLGSGQVYLIDGLERERKGKERKGKDLEKHKVPYLHVHPTCTIMYLGR